MSICGCSLPGPGTDLNSSVTILNSKNHRKLYHFRNSRRIISLSVTCSFCCLTAFHTTLTLLQGNATLSFATEARRDLKYLTPGFDSSHTRRFLNYRVHTLEGGKNTVNFFPASYLASRIRQVSDTQLWLKTFLINQHGGVHVFRPGLSLE